MFFIRHQVFLYIKLFSFNLKFHILIALFFCLYIHLFSLKNKKKKNTSEFTPSLFIGLLLIENVTNKATVVTIVFHCI